MNKDLHVENETHFKSKIEVQRHVRNSKSENMTSSGENGLNIRTNASPKWDRTYH